MYVWARVVVYVQKKQKKTTGQAHAAEVTASWGSYFKGPSVAH